MSRLPSVTITLVCADSSDRINCEDIEHEERGTDYSSYPILRFRQPVPDLSILRFLGPVGVKRIMQGGGVMPILRQPYCHRNIGFGTEGPDGIDSKNPRP